MTHDDQTPVPFSPQSSAASPIPVSPTADFYYEMEKERTLREYIDILLRRKWWVIGTFLTIVCLAALYTFTRHNIYRSQATIQITNDNPGSQLSGNVGMMGWFESQNFQETQYKILESRSLALRVIKALKLDETPDFAILKEGTEGLSKTEIDDLMAEVFLSKLTIEPVEETYLVNVAYDSDNKLTSKKVIDTLADEYMYLIIDRRNQSFQLVMNWLNKQLDEWAYKVQEAQNKLYKFEIYNFICRPFIHRQCLCKHR